MFNTVCCRKHPVSDLFARILDNCHGDIFRKECLYDTLHTFKKSELFYLKRSLSGGGFK